jgi:hypothetical protein
MELNIGQLKELIKDLPDNTPFKVYDTDINNELLIEGTDDESNQGGDFTINVCP